MPMIGGGFPEDGDCTRPMAAASSKVNGMSLFPAPKTTRVPCARNWQNPLEKLSYTIQVAVTASETPPFPALEISRVTKWRKWKHPRFDGAVETFAITYVLLLFCANI